MNQSTRMPMSLCLSFSGDSKDALDVSDLTGDDPANCFNPPVVGLTPRKKGPGNVSFEEEQPRQELVDAKLQIARQREELDELRSELSRSRVEIAALKAKNAALVKEGSRRPSPAPRFSFKTNRGGSMQMLVGSSALVMEENARLAKENALIAEENARLMEKDLQLTNENTRIQASVDGLQRSLCDYIRFSERLGREEGEKNEALRIENEALRGRIGDLECDGAPSSGGCTAGTSFETEGTSEGVNGAIRRPVSDSPRDGIPPGSGGSAFEGLPAGDLERRVAGRGHLEPSSLRGGSGELIVDFVTPRGIRINRATMP